MLVRVSSYSTVTLFDALLAATLSTPGIRASCFSTPWHSSTASISPTSRVAVFTWISPDLKRSTRSHAPSPTGLPVIGWHQQSDSRMRLRSAELATTDSELSAIAAAAMIGLR
jgi:hypothetical protein